MTLTKIFIFSFLFLLSSSLYAEEGFPGRDKYPDVPYVSLNDLHAGYLNNEYVIIDARSIFEYKVIKIKGAINAPLSQNDFFAKVNKLAKTTGKPLVFYCNGRRCMKSYKAAIASKLANVFVFDAGIFEWTVAHPNDAVLLGKSPVDPNDLIAKSKLKEHFLPIKEFESHIKGSVLIDVRDLKQRRGSGLFLLADKSVPLDNKRKLTRYLNKALNENKTLLAYDNTGKQVRWLQYHLEDMGITDYYFMKGGAKLYAFGE